MREKWFRCVKLCLDIRAYYSGLFNTIFSASLRHTKSHPTHLSLWHPRPQACRCVVQAHSIHVSPLIGTTLKLTFVLTHTHTHTHTKNTTSRTTRRIHRIHTYKPKSAHKQRCTVYYTHFKTPVTSTITTTMSQGYQGVGAF